MGETTGIAWTDMTLNFWWGCVKVSPGCEHCYAETLSAYRGKKIWGPAKTTDRWRTKGPWKDCVKWDDQAGKDGVRRNVFVMSMGDFFEDHPQVKPWREEAFPILEGFKNLNVQLLTKRIDCVLDMVPASWITSWPKHVLIGTSIENQKTADERIPVLLKIKRETGARTWLSIEPQIERIDLLKSVYHFYSVDRTIDWAIVGGESGGGRRPFDVEWARTLLMQCRSERIPFFMKQLGGHPYKRDKMEDFPEDLRVREFPV